MVHLLYFSWVRERIGKSEETIRIPASVRSITDLVEYLKAQDKGYLAALHDMQYIRIAVNQVHTTSDHAISDGDEIAFFPPVTGG